MYMLRAYQSPASGTHWAPQWAHSPNLASRNQSGVRYPAASESQLGLNGPLAIWSKPVGTRSEANAGAAPIRLAAALPWNSARLVGVIVPLPSFLSLNRIANMICLSCQGAGRGPRCVQAL